MIACHVTKSSLRIRGNSIDLSVDWTARVGVVNLEDDKVASFCANHQ